MNDASAGADVFVICGPTAAGKSDIALRVAELTGRGIVVADSRQVYRGFDLGTAKPTPAEQQRVHHYAIDVAEPTERFSAAQWAAIANDALRARAGESRPIVVGGTGLYLRSLFEGLFREPEVDAGRRMALLDWLDGQPTSELRRWVRELDAARAPLGRTQLLRAVEVALVGSSRVDLQACKLEYSIVSPK